MHSINTLSRSIPNRGERLMSCIRRRTIKVWNRTRFKRRTICTSYVYVYIARTAVNRNNREVDPKHFPTKYHKTFNVHTREFHIGVIKFNWSTLKKKNKLIVFMVSNKNAWRWNSASTAKLIWTLWRGTHYFTAITQNIRKMLPRSMWH